SSAVGSTWSTCNSFWKTDELRRLRRLGVAIGFDVPDETELLQQHDLQIRDVDFPPSVPIGGTRWRMMVVVVPSFADADERDEPVVGAVVARVVVAIAPNMAE